MSLPYEGDSSDPNVAGIIGINTAGGIGVKGSGGPAGFFEGDVAITGNITAQDIILAGQISVGSAPNPGAVVVNDSQGNAGVKLNGGTVGGSISVAGTAAIGDRLTVTGKVSALGDLTVAGNVGIGTTTPVEPLDVKAAPNCHFGAFINTPGAVSIGAFNDGFTAWQPLSVNAGGQVWFMGGNVGIGTTSPQRKLQIGDDVNGLSFDPGTSPDAGVFRFGDNTGWKLHFGRSREASGGTPNSGVNGSLMTIQDNGNVGIGTAGPADKLHVLAEGNGGGIVIQNTPTNDTISALSSLKLVTRAKGGNDKTWALYTAAIGGGFGVQPNAFEIWEYPETQPRFQINPGGPVNVGGDLSVGGNMFIHGTDLQLNGRSGGTKRALVDGGDGLIINFAQDYSGGVEINGLVVIRDLLVNGNLTVAGHKGFRIDHPLDPDNKYLNHFCVESSEAKNLYDGRAKLNENGEAVVELPAWFQAINKNFQYQLTALGKFAPLYIADELRNDRFTIAGGEPDMEICWQVTGVRNDAYVQAHPTVVEEGKI